jgi:threonine dehydrogenase-like Zn-dependent dehydrogenase
VVDLNPNRLATLKLLGAELALQASTDDPIDAIRRWTGDEGVDFAVDAVGLPICRRNVITCTSRGGHVVWIGLAGDVAEVDGRDVVTREVSIQGTYAYTKANFAEAIRLISEKTFPLERVVSEFTLEQGQQTFEALTSSDSSIMKAVFRI